MVMLWSCGARGQHPGDDEDPGLALWAREGVHAEQTEHGGAPVRVLLPGRHWSGAQELAAAVEGATVAGREESVVPDADEARGQHVLEEELGEGLCAERAVCGLAIRPILVAEGDVLAVVVLDAGVGDGDAVDVPGQVVWLGRLARPSMNLTKPVQAMTLRRVGFAGRAYLR
jgi:hypothetical protein